MSYPKLEIYPRAKALTGTEDVLISQGGVNKKTSSQSIADLAASAGGAGNGTVGVWGDVSAFITGDLLAVKSDGTLVKADASDSTKMPCIGVFIAASGGDPAVIRTVGRGTTGFSGLTTGSTYYVNVGGGATTTAPTASGTISQRVFKATGATSAFVQIGEPITNS